MNTRTILIGIIVIFSIGVFSYYLGSNQGIIDNGVTEIQESPKPGDKYYIEPERKERLEAAELDLRDKIQQLHQKKSLGSFAVNLDHDTQEIIVIVENEQFNSEIKEIISRYPEDIPIVFSNGKFEIRDFTEKERSEILSQLRKKPQNVNGAARQFIISEAVSDSRVRDLIKDTSYQINCCTYTLDGNEYPYPLYIGITFQINEKDMYVVAGYDLQQEKVSGVEVHEGIRSGGAVPFKPET